MGKLFRPFNFRKRGKYFQDVVLTLTVSALLSSFIVLGVAFWAILHPPRYHQSNYASYYNTAEYKRLMEETQQLNNTVPAQSEIQKATPAAGNRQVPSLK